MILSTKKRKEKINVPQFAVSKRLTRIIQSQTVKQSSLENLQYDMSDEPVNGYSRLDCIGRQIEEWNNYCNAKANEENAKQAEENRPKESSSDSKSGDSEADS